MSVFEDEPDRLIRRAKLLTKDEARRIAANIAKLPEPSERILNWAGDSLVIKSITKRPRVRGRFSS